MTNLKRKISAISLLLALICPAAITYSYLKYQKKQVKRTLKWRMIANTDRNDLVHFKFTNDEATKELRWEHSKEFEYRGQMYDVVESEVKGDTIYYTCWWDSEETALNRKLTGIVSLAWGHNDQKKEKEGRLLSYFKSLFHEELSAITFKITNSALSQNSFAPELTSRHGRSVDKVPKA